MELFEWISGRERTALRRVRTVGLGLAAVLVVLAVWLGWRESKLSPLPKYVGEAVQAENTTSARLGLKMLSMVAYLAKVRENSLLADMTGRHDISAPCLQLDCMRGLDASSPCAIAWENILTRIWKAAFGLEAPPIWADMLRDPWGAPELLDQSEASCGKYGEWCPQDVLSTAGPDGKANTGDDIQEPIPQHLGLSRAKQSAGTSPAQ